MWGGWCNSEFPPMGGAQGGFSLSGDTLLPTTTTSHSLFLLLHIILVKHYSFVQTNHKIRPLTAFARRKRGENQPTKSLQIGCLFERCRYQNTIQMFTVCSSNKDVISYPICRETEGTFSWVLGLGDGNSTQNSRFLGVPPNATIKSKCGLWIAEIFLFHNQNFGLIALRELHSYTL